MPVNLADLPTDKPLPNGRVQIKRGVTDGSQLINTGTAQGSKLGDGAGGLMQISVTPVHNCIWIVCGNVMYIGATDGIGWRRIDHAIQISPADMDGRTLGFVCPIQVYDYSTVQWRTVSSSAAFRLAGGATYTAYLSHWFCEKGSAYYHSGPLWIRIVGRTISEGVI